MSCLCKQLKIKIGDKVKWNGKDINPDLGNPFTMFYKSKYYTVNSISHFPNWKNVHIPICFIHFTEFVERGGGGWGLSELSLVRRKKLKLKLP